MFPITFNAFGDIVTAAEILYGLAKALSETRGAPVDYRRYITDLRTMAGTMGQIHSIFLTSDALDDSVRDLVLVKVEECYTCAQTAFDRVARVRDLGVASSSDAGIVRRIRRGLCKIEWHVWSRGDATKVQEEMKAAQQYLQTAMAVVNYCETVELGSQVSSIRQDGQAMHMMLDEILFDNSCAREHDAVLIASVDRTHAGVQAMDLRVMEVLARVSVLHEEFRAMRVEASTNTRADVQSIRSSMHLVDSSLAEVLDHASSVRKSARVSCPEPTLRRRPRKPSVDGQALEQCITEVLETLRSIQDRMSSIQDSSRARFHAGPDLPLQKLCPRCNETVVLVGTTQTYMCTSTVCEQQRRIAEEKSPQGSPARPSAVLPDRSVQSHTMLTESPSEVSSTPVPVQPQEPTVPVPHDDRAEDAPQAGVLFLIAFKAFSDIITAAKVLDNLALCLSIYGRKTHLPMVTDLRAIAATMSRLHSTTLSSSSSSLDSELSQFVLLKIEECCSHVEKALSPQTVIRQGPDGVIDHLRRGGDLGMTKEGIHLARHSLKNVTAFIMFITSGGILSACISLVHSGTLATPTVLEFLREHAEERKAMMKMIDHAVTLQENVRVKRRDCWQIGDGIRTLRASVEEMMRGLSSGRDLIRGLLMDGTAVRAEVTNIRAILQAMDRRATGKIQVYTSINVSIEAVQSRLAGHNRHLPLENVCPWCTHVALEVGLPKDYVWTLPCCREQCHLLEKRSTGTCSHFEQRQGDHV